LERDAEFWLGLTLASASSRKVARCPTYGKRGTSEVVRRRTSKISYSLGSASNLRGAPMQFGTSDCPNQPNGNQASAVDAAWIYRGCRRASGVAASWNWRHSSAPSATAVPPTFSGVRNASGTRSITAMRTGNCDSGSAAPNWRSGTGQLSWTLDRGISARLRFPPRQVRSKFLRICYIRNAGELTSFR
jgi:hypothetical protein